MVRCCFSVLVIFSIIWESCNYSPKIQSKENNQSKISTHKTFIKTIHNKTGWGYNIYLDSVLYVHQPYIPAINGNKEFSSEEDAEKVGKLASDKILNGVIPPTISIEELKKLGINM